MSSSSHVSIRITPVVYEIILYYFISIGIWWHDHYICSGLNDTNPLHKHRVLAI
jgi:hypothetical protein